MEEAKGGGPSGPTTAKTPNARSGKIQAIKESQEEQDRFINKSLVDEE